MGLLRRLADRFEPTEKRHITSWDMLSGTAVPGIVNAHTAENLSTVLACVSAIASTMASLPAYVYRVSERGREILEDHPVSRLIALGPNTHQSWPDFIEWLMASVLLRGNALAEVETDGRGIVTGLKPIAWDWVSVQLLKNQRLAYDVTELIHAYGGTGRPHRLLQDEVLHLRDRTDDGLIGRSRLQRAAAVVAAGISIQTFANTLYLHGVNPSGALQAEGKLTPEAREQLNLSFRQLHAGADKAAKALILDQGLKWQQISVSPEDAEFLASRRFTVEELARLFGVPPPVVGDLSHSTYTNSETMIRHFGVATLSPWIRKLEAEFSRSIFTDPAIRLEIDLSGLMRGDPSQRWASHEIAIRNNILTVDEVREIEGFNPRGDVAREPAVV